MFGYVTNYIMRWYIVLINQEEGLGRVRGNKALYKRMLSMFIDTKDAEQLDVFLEQGNLEEASHSSHAIKGIAGNLSLIDLFAISDKLTEELRKNIKDEATIAEFHDILAETRNVVGETILTL